MNSEQLDDCLSAEDVVDEELEEQQDTQTEAVTDAQMDSLVRTPHQLSIQHAQISEHTTTRGSVKHYSFKQYDYYSKTPQTVPLDNVFKQLSYNNHTLNVLPRRFISDTHLWMSCCDFCMDAIEASICARSFFSLLHLAHWLPKPKDNTVKL